MLHDMPEKIKFRFMELLIFEFVRRGDLWSPTKCFEFAGNLVIIPQFHHCRFTTMTGRPQVAPTVLYDRLLDKSEFDEIWAIENYMGLWYKFHRTMMGGNL